MFWLFKWLNVVRHTVDKRHQTMYDRYCFLFYFGGLQSAEGGKKRKKKKGCLRYGEQIGNDVGLRVSVI